MSETYRVGVYYPVYILCDSMGNIISRWTGYTGADRFIKAYNQARSDLTTLKARISRCQASPSIPDLTFLAKYYSDSREHLKAITCYRQLSELNKGNIDYSFQIFLSSAEAVWNDQLIFDSLATAADKVLAVGQQSPDRIRRLAQIISNVARRTGKTNRIEKYLSAGLKATSSRTDEKNIAFHRDLQADYALHAQNDTTGALNIKKQSLGQDWESDPSRYYQFGNFCFKRGINLAEAENFVRRATNLASDGKFKAKHLRLLAEICHARGRSTEAISLGKQALDQDPTALNFEKTLGEWQKK